MIRITQIVALALVVALAAGCSRHSGQAAQKAARKPSDAAVIAVRPDAPVAGSSEKATAITEESEGATDIPAGLSPIAAAVAQSTPAPATPIPSRWVEGKHYLTLLPAQPTTVAPDRVEVVEVFWYGCGHCFHFDPTVEAWRKTKKPAYVEFTRVPVMWNEVTRAHARLFYTIDKLGRREELHPLVFREIHINGNGLFDPDADKTEAMQRDFVTSHGVNATDFTNAYRSLEVAGSLRRAEDLTRRYHAASVPWIVVNGKYTTDIDHAGNEEALMELINDLAASERRH